jgi:hypothetical protein
MLVSDHLRPLVIISVGKEGMLPAVREAHERSQSDCDGLRRQMLAPAGHRNAGLPVAVRPTALVMRELQLYFQSER